MKAEVSQPVTQLLQAAGEGDERALDRLFERVYGELKRLAHKVRTGRAGDTLHTTALVHEAYIKLVPSSDVVWQNRAHFFGAAAIAIRRVLVEHARRRARLKRGGGAARVDLGDVDPAGAVPDEALLELDEALARLAAFAPEHARIVELRFFADRSLPEIAKLTGVSVSTVQREWRLARAWLKSELAGDGP